MRARFGSKTDIGRARERNEDSLLVKAPLFVVADGMGGHRGGNVASSLATQKLGEADLRGDGPLRALVGQIKEANKLVLQRGESDRDLRGMGTTVTALLLDGEKAHVAHVGDSRAYLLRSGALQQLTEDHTLVQRMVREGKLTPDQAVHHPQRSIITRALGVEEELPVDELTLSVQDGDRLLLATDGLTAMVEEAEIKAILEAEADPQSACDRLVEAANRGGGEDNITVVVLDFVVEGPGDAARTDAAAAAPAPAVGRSTQETRASGAGTSNDVAPTMAMAASATAATGTRTAERPAPTGPAESIAEPTKERKRGIRWGRVALWLGVLAAVVVAALVGTRLYVDGQWYVGESQGRVAVYNGIPTAVFGYKLSHVDQLTGLSAAQAELLQPWKGLKDGITASSKADAERVVTQISQDLSQSKTGAGG